VSTVSLIAACDRHGLIGRAGDLPWRLPADLAHFKRLTLGKPVIMGRRTWASLGRPLPGRRNIVVTRQPGYAAPGAEVAASPAAALALAADAAEVMVIGGAQLYAACASRADRLYLTRVEGEFTGDTWFPFAALATPDYPAPEADRISPSPPVGGEGRGEGGQPEAPADPFAWLDAHPHWRLIERAAHPADARNAHACTFLTYQRLPAS